MPGLYSVVSRAPGTLITALIYNSDHQAHVDGRSAMLMQSNGASLSQFNLQESPFGADGTTENLPLSLAGELTRLRFVIAAIKTALSGGVPTVWWMPIPAPGFATIGARVARPTNISVPNNTLTTISFAGATTADFNSGVWEGVVHPTRFTAPVKGLYYVAAGVLWDLVTPGGTAPGGRRQLQVGVNGTFNQQIKTNTTTTGKQQWQTVTGLQKLSANDYVEFAGFQDSGGSLNLITAPPESIFGALVFFGSTP
jgi:hypothetical protein